MASTMIRKNPYMRTEKKGSQPPTGGSVSSRHIGNPYHKIISKPSGKITPKHIGVPYHGKSKGRSSRGKKWMLSDSGAMKGY